MRWVLALLWMGLGTSCGDRCNARCLDTISIDFDVASDEGALLGDSITVCDNDECVTGTIQDPSPYGEVQLTGSFSADVNLSSQSAQTAFQIVIYDGGPYGDDDVYSVDIADGSGSTIFENGAVAMYIEHSTCGYSCTVASLQL
jgi:hypothetical protein